MKHISEAAKAGVDFIQLREKDLPARDLESLAEEAIQRVRGERTATRLLVNSRTDVAIACFADGVHLRSDDISPEDVLSTYGTISGLQPRLDPLIAVSCHCEHDVRQAASSAATFAVFAPVFEKRGSAPVGLEMLAQACRYKIPVLALGGVTLGNFKACLSAGAAGIAGIRLFQEADLRQTVASLRKSG